MLTHDIQVPHVVSFSRREARKNLSYDTEFIRQVHVGVSFVYTHCIPFGACVAATRQSLAIFPAVVLESTKEGFCCDMGAAGTKNRRAVIYAGELAVQLGTGRCGFSHISAACHLAYMVRIQITSLSYYLKRCSAFKIRRVHKPSVPPSLRCSRRNYGIHSAVFRMFSMAYA